VLVVSNAVVGFGVGTVIICAAALCVAMNPIAVAATITSAVIDNDVLFICILVL
jgi:hypothetical protein